MNGILLLMRPAGNDRQRSTILDVATYDVALDLTHDEDKFWSRTEVHFRCRQPGASSWADLHAASVRKATLNGADISGRYRDGRLELPALNDDNILLVEAEFFYATTAEGMHYVTAPENGTPFVYSKTYPHWASRIFCCFDQSDLRAVFTVSIRAPQGWSCLANAPLISRPPHGEPGSWWFAPTAPIAPWLTSLCAGPLSGSAFACARTGNSPLPVTVQAVPSAADHLETVHVADMLRQPLEYYERSLGVPYPYETCDLVFAPISPMLAYSVTGLIIIQDQVLQSAETALFKATMIAHELAHAWFGGLVTLPGEDMWLDEALTTYISREALEQTIPGATPWAPSTSADLPDHYYARNAEAIRQLEDLIGKSAVIDGLRALMRDRAHADASKDDLVRCWAQASGQNLQEWAAEFLVPVAEGERQALP